MGRERYIITGFGQNGIPVKAASACDLRAEKAPRAQERMKPRAKKPEPTGGHFTLKRMVLTIAMEAYLQRPAKKAKAAKSNLKKTFVSIC
jgi:hypothetical protein